MCVVWWKSDHDNPFLMYFQNFYVFPDLPTIPEMHNNRWLHLMQLLQ